MVAPWIAEFSQDGERRRWPRYALGAAGRFTLTADGRTCGCAIEDISLGGARLQLDGEIPRNLEVRIEHPAAGHAYAARCWAESTRMGVEFDVSARALDFIAYCLELASVPEPLAAARPAAS